MTVELWLRIVLAVIIFILFCVGVCVWPNARSAFEQWREKRAIAKRDAASAKRHADMLRWGLACYPRETRRIPNSNIDPARSTGQFSVPDRSMRDMKGVTR